MCFRYLRRRLGRLSRVTDWTICFAASNADILCQWWLWRFNVTRSISILHFRPNISSSRIWFYDWYLSPSCVICVYEHRFLCDILCSSCSSLQTFWSREPYFSTDQLHNENHFDVNLVPYCFFVLEYHIVNEQFCRKFVTASVIFSPVVSLSITFTGIFGVFGFSLFWCR